jgi:multiple sugar transport system permease protein
MSAGPYAVTRAGPATVAQIFIAVVLIVTPIVWMVVSSLKTGGDVTAYPPKLFFSPTLANYTELWAQTPFLSYGLNSLIVAGGSTLLGLLLGVPMAFAVSYQRLTWPASAVLVARMAPGTLFLLPWYVMFSSLGLIGRHEVLVLTHCVITLPMVVWIMLPYFDAVPRELHESATIDGATAFGIFRLVSLPLVAPGMVVATILAFVFSWNYFLFALVLSGFRSKTLIVAAFNFVGEGVSAWGTLMAASVLIALPPLLLALVVQRWLIAGLTGGAVKG